MLLPLLAALLAALLATVANAQGGGGNSGERLPAQLYELCLLELMNCNSLIEALLMSRLDSIAVPAAGPRCQAHRSATAGGATPPWCRRFLLPQWLLL